MIARLASSALLLTAALFASGAGAQEIRIERVGFSAPVAGAAAAAPLGASALSGGGLSLAASPSLLAAPSIRTLAAGPSALTPAAVPAAAAVGRDLPAAEAVEAAAAPAALPAGARGSAPAVENKIAARALENVRGAAEISAPAAADSPRSSELDRDAASRDFSALLGERLVEGRGGVAAPSRARLVFAAVPATLAAALPTLHPSLAMWHKLSVGGYVAGNVGAAIFPLVQIHQALHGKSTPRSRAIVGAAASLALGLICAPLLHKTLWGVQNIFGGLTLLVPLLVGAMKGVVHGSGLKETALISAAALAVSGAVYFAAAAAVPALLGALFSAAAIAKLAFAVQSATSAMFLWMFLPDVVKVLRGKAAGGFSPGFNLMFFLSAVGSMAWAVPSAWIYAGADQNTYRLIFAVNAIYALASFVSYWSSRRESKP